MLETGNKENIYPYFSVQAPQWNDINLALRRRTGHTILTIIKRHCAKVIENQ